MSTNGNGKPKKPAKKAAKKPGRNPGTPSGKVPTLKPGPKGGMLWAGPTGKPVAGPGRPTNEIRAQLRSILDQQGVPFVKSVLSGEVSLTLREVCEHCGKEPTKKLSPEEIAKRIPTIGDQMSAFDSAARFSIGTVKGISEEQIVEKVRDTLQLVFDELGQDGYVRVLPRLRSIWKLGE